MGSWDFNVPALNLCIQNSTNIGLTTADFMRPPSGHNADTLEIQIHFRKAFVTISYGISQ